MKRRTRRILTLCAAVLSAMVLSVPITGLIGAVGHVEAAKETVLRVGFMQTVDHLNPMVGLTDAAYVFYGLVYDAVHAVGEDFETVENLATATRIVPATDPRLITSGEPYGSVWEFDITQNATWHDREPLTVDDVIYTINLNCQNYEAMWAYQPYAYFMKYAERIDEDTVRIHFYDRVSGEPIPAIYPNLICIPILPKHMLEGMTAYDIAFTWSGVFPGHNPPIVGTGPFKATKDIYKEWLDGNYLTLERNPDYHWKFEKGKVVQFDKLRMYFYDEATAMRLALERGELDIAQFPPHEFRTIENAVKAGTLKNITTFAGLKCTQYWTEIGINMNNAGPNPSRLDPAIRKAMAMATNKTYIVQNYYFGYAEEGTTLISPVNTKWHYEPTEAERIKFDIQAAKDLLDRAGYIDINRDGVREATAASWAVQEGLVEEGTELAYDMMIRREYPEEKDIAMYLDQKWAEIGIDITYRIMSEPALSTEAYAYKYDTMIWYWSADPDPNFMLFCQSRNSWDGWSDNMYYNPDYEENYTKSVSALDPAERKTYTDNCQRINYEDAAYILLAYAYQTYAWRNDTFEGYGDWAAHPARSFDAFWSGNPLWFDLVPITPNTPPVASFVVSPDIGDISTVFTVNAAASFDLEDSQALLEVRWDWDGDDAWDTSWSTMKVATHQYDETGTFSIRLEVRDSEGLTNTTTKNVHVLNTPPVASFVVEPLSGYVDTEFTFDASACSDLEASEETLEVRWDWENDGIYDTGWGTAKVETHKFGEAGVYTVRLEVRDSEGLSSYATLQINVAKKAGVSGYVAIIIAVVALVISLIALTIVILKHRPGGGSGDEKR